MTPPCVPLSRAAHVLCALLAFACVTIKASPVTEKDFDIPAGDAAFTLKRFVAQSGEQIVYPVDRVRGVRTHRVRGKLAARAALDRMLDGTELHVVEDAATGALAVKRTLLPETSAPAPAPAPAPPSRPTPLLTPISRARPLGSADDVLALNPFEVQTTPDRGYGVLESNSLTAFRIDLDKLPATATVFTRTLMDDLAATSIEETILNYGGAVGPGAGDVMALVNPHPGDRNGAGVLSLRGMNLRGGLRRDGFIGQKNGIRNATGSTDNYSAERVEVISGPQSLLYGGTGGGGIVNIVSKQARFQAVQRQLQFRFDRYGSRRGVLDVNVGGERLAVRVAAAAEEFRTDRLHLGGTFTGLYAQAALRLTPTTTLRVWGERTATDANHSFRPANLNDFLPLADPRRDLDPRYLVLTGQTQDLDVIDGGLSTENVGSFTGWWSSERIANAFAGAKLETTLNRWLSAQLVAIYGETKDVRIDPANRGVFPAGVAGNPLGQTAVFLTPGINDQPSRRSGYRATLLAEAELFGGRARSQTAIGAEYVHTTDHDNVDYRYYLADAEGNVVIDPARLDVDYGRSELAGLWFPVQHGLPARPLFQPRTARITVDGATYVLQPVIIADPAQAGPGNIYGLVPNRGAGYVGNWSRADAHHHGAFIANYTSWFDGRFTTLAGVRFGRSASLNVGPGFTSWLPAWDDASGWNLGVTYSLAPTLRAYASLSTSYDSQSAQTRDLYGRPLLTVSARAPQPELGLRFASPAGRFSAQLAFAPAVLEENQAQSRGVDVLNSVNPEGINGRFGRPDQWVNLDREASSLELTATASPTRNWRLRLVGSYLDGEIKSGVSYRTLYNDQFHARSGLVTHADGMPLLVDPTGQGGVASMPLTVAMLNDPANPYFAAPHPDSGAITNQTLRAVLTAVDPVHGAAATGVSGLPLSSIQYIFTDPNHHRGEIEIFRAGEKTTGSNEFNLNLQSHVTVGHGPLTGLSVFADVRTYWRNRAYYVQRGDRVNGTRELYRLPTATVVGAGLGYTRKLRGGLTWTTQLNVQNLFNHYEVWIMPQPNGGAFTLARLSTQPRQFLWTNTITF